MKTSSFFWLLTFVWFSTAGLQGQAVRWQSSFEEKTFDQCPDSADALAYFLSADASVTDSTFVQMHADLSDFCRQLAKKRKKSLSESYFLHYVFKQVSQRYLHQYQPYPLFTGLQDNVYNCVSGTALYAWMLGKLGFEIEIRETNRHVYLRVKTEKSNYLMDATDPENGFVSEDEMQIVRRELWYASNELMQGKPYNRSITLRELAGLQYFNEAVKAFNRRAYESCMQHLTKAGRLYRESTKIMNLHELTQNRLQPVWTASKNVSLNAEK